MSTADWRLMVTSVDWDYRLGIQQSAISIIIINLQSTVRQCLSICSLHSSVFSELRGVAKIYDVAVEDDVLLALEAEFRVVAAARDRSARQQVLVAAHFGADEAALDVGVDLAG